MNDRGFLIVIVAPSGTGKSTLISKLKKEFPFITESVSFTTRPKREGELDGVHYHFISKDEFSKRKEDDEFLEWAKVHSNYYGTSKSYVSMALEPIEVFLLETVLHETLCIANELQHQSLQLHPFRVF